MWAKQTVLQDNKRLRRELRQALQEIEVLESYIKGINVGRRRKHEDI